MVDNLELIKPFLVFDSEDDFYHLQIIKRKKENPELGSNSYIVKTYSIISVDHLEKVYPEIKAICDFHQARAGINLNVRSFEKIAFHALRKLTDVIMNKDFRSARKSYDSVCGSFSAGKNKSWIIDIDVSDMDVVKSIAESISEIEPKGDKVKTVLPTKNGFHLITSPFNLSKVGFFEIDIHKNNPTILYVPD
jgi:hypothetical protein